MRLDPITVSTRLQIAWRDLCPENLHFFILLLSGGHSSLDPRLPIPNRTVKRVCAADSVHSARESRLPPGHLQAIKPGLERGPGFFVGGHVDARYRQRALVVNRELHRLA